MRVICQTIGEFLENLKGDCENVLGKTIWISRVRTSLDGNQKEAVRFSIVLQASAVVGIGEDGQYILEAGEHCGTDYEDTTQDRQGSEVADVLRREIVSFCNDRGLTIRPGIIDM